jgi:hypothetical protein
MLVLQLLEHLLQLLAGFVQLNAENAEFVGSWILETGPELTACELPGVVDNGCEFRRHVACEERGDKDRGKKSKRHGGQQLIADLEYARVDVVQRHRQPKSTLRNRHGDVQQVDVERTA